MLCRHFNFLVQLDSTDILHVFSPTIGRITLIWFMSNETCHFDTFCNVIVITQHREIFSFYIEFLHPIRLFYISFVGTQIYINPFDTRNFSIIIVTDRIVIKQLEYMPYHIMRLLKAILSRLHFHLVSNHWTVRVSPPYHMDSRIWPQCLRSCAAEKPVDVKAIRHDDVIKWRHFPRCWPFVRGIHRSPVNSPHKGQWRWALMFSLICVWING